MSNLFQIQVRNHSGEEFKNEGKALESEVEQTKGLVQLNWIEPGFEWRIVKIVDGVIIATGKIDWDTYKKGSETKVTWQVAEQKELYGKA